MLVRLIGGRSQDFFSIIEGLPSAKVTLFLSFIAVMKQKPLHHPLNLPKSQCRLALCSSLYNLVVY